MASRQRKTVRPKSPPSLPDRLRRILREHGPLAAWAAETQKSLKEPAFQRDPKFLRALLPLMEVMNRYFDAEVRGFENLPKKGPMLLVGNHSGGILTPDTTAFISTWYRKRGLDAPLIGLAFDAVFSVPGMRTIMRKIGQVPASRKNAARALDAGAAVLVYPGGDHEVFRPWTDRNRIDFGGRKGFIKLALSKRIPVVPVVGHGGHETTFVLTRGDWIAKQLPLEDLRMEVWPILWQIPWGLSPAGLPSLPLPAKITVQICKPIDWSRYRPKDANDPVVLERCYDQITGVMQKTLDRLAAENPYPLLSRLRHLLPGGSAPERKARRGKRAKRSPTRSVHASRPTHKK